MKRKKCFDIKYLFLALCLLISGCIENKNLEEIATAIINLNISDNGNDINDYIELSHYIPLETKQDVLIGNINKLQIINSNIYILDNTTQSVYIFDKNGKYINKISKQGRAANEYTRITDFEVMPNGEILVYDSSKKTILKYNQNGEFINTFSEFSGDAFKVLNNNLIAVNGGNGFAENGQSTKNNYNYIVVKEDKVLKTDIPFNNNLIGRNFLFGEGKSSFYLYENKIFMSPPLSNIIYEISHTDGSIIPYTKYDFNTPMIDLNSSEQDAMSYIKKIMSGEQPTPPYSFYKLSNANMIMYNYQNSVYLAISSLDGKHLFQSKSIYDKYGLPIMPIPYYDSDNSGYIITSLKPHNLDLFLKLSKKNGYNPQIITELISKTNENSNPVLIFYNWKYTN